MWKEVLANRLDNLIKMAEWLETECTQAEFHMDFYRRDLGCGTVGCIIGSIPKVFGVEPYDEPRIGLRWELLARDTFDVRLQFPESESIWKFEWLFDASWHVLDNTPVGAAKRIGYFIAKKGRIPEWYAPIPWEVHRKIYLPGEQAEIPWRKQYEEEVLMAV